MSIDADAIRDAEIDELQRRIHELEKRLREPYPWGPAYPVPYPNPQVYPWPYTAPYRPFRVWW